jgi:hypothetical protein
MVVLRLTNLLIVYNCRIIQSLLSPVAPGYQACFNWPIHRIINGIDADLSIHNLHARGLAASVSRINQAVRDVKLFMDFGAVVPSSST